VNDQCSSSFPVLIKLGDLDSSSYTHVRVGDVVTIFGQFETSTGHYTNTCFNAKRIELVEKWDTERYGTFGYIPPWNSAAAHSRSVATQSCDLISVIQCQVEVVDRVVLYLKTKFPNLYIENSLSPFSITQDRLVGIWSPLDHQQDILDQLVSDRVLTYTISRVYKLNCPNLVATTLDHLTDMLCQGLKPIVTSSSSIPSIRVHAFPKQIPIESIARKIVDFVAVKFDPRIFTHTITIVFVNGLWYGSVGLADTSVGQHLYRSSQSLSVSKASQKLFESFSRIEKLWGSDLVSLSGKIALDIGASPGGWSYYMALERDAEKVIAVDNGVLVSPTPPAVDHWKMKGEEAIEKLLRENERQFISCFTCDMNTDCLDTVNLFLSAIPLMAHPSIAILTLKQTIKNKEKWETRKSKAIEKLANFCVEEIHLIANTPNETTLLVRLD
jgi:23S rRNA U2552 (ribose-2'-O)-methylase RlmE/FtsJ